MAANTIADRLRQLPSVERTAAALADEPRGVAVAAARAEIAEMRRRILAGEAVDPDEALVRDAAARRAASMRAASLRAVINATGVVLHTNLGRAPLAAPAAEAAEAVARGYSNLELDLEDGRRGSRHAHVEGLVRELCGAEAAIAVNNNAAAVLLAVTALASGREVIVGRGQLVEIGGSFRIPDVLAQSGARLVEVGTTNRTRAADYAAAVGPDTAAILRVHQSNFRTVGFVEEAELRELAALARERGIALVDDLGSGALGEIVPGGGEPPLEQSVAAGADLVCCSADKLLGGPQAGIVAGRAGAVERCRHHPLARALRLDKLQLAALEATLRLHRDGRSDEIPALAMLAAGDAELEPRARAMAREIGPRARVATASSRPGGGALPLTELRGPACLVDPGAAGADALAAALRRGEPPVLARIAGGEVVLDPRTMSDEEALAAARAVRRCLG